jgi:hypothetical protein
MAAPIVGENKHRHSLGLALIPGGDQAFGILKHLGVGRGAHRGLFLRDGAALILHLAAVEAHGTVVGSLLPPLTVEGHFDLAIKFGAARHSFHGTG